MKKKYVKPVLVKYGQLKEITKAYNAPSSGHCKTSTCVCG